MSRNFRKNAKFVDFRKVVHFCGQIVHFSKQMFWCKRFKFFVEKNSAKSFVWGEQMTNIM